MDRGINGKKGCSIVVYGIVQGIGYRYSALKAASRFHVDGWVRNNSDGSVEIDCEGNAEDLAEFIGWLKKGPPYARITSVDIRYKDYQGIYSGFSIEY
ncbi:MAG: acylphosphatase [Spirochaetia bacterium]|jgi:acylphosphatase|nr:acylphosphatase [Spirochaetia bacterium]